MISLVRIDDRLIHGQVAVVWTKHLGVNRILVANDQIVNRSAENVAAHGGSRYRKVRHYGGEGRGRCA